MINIEDYNNENIFAKVLRKEIPSEKIYEDDLIYAFKDINPQAPVHVLIIPKERFCSFKDFSQNAGDNLVVSITRVIGKIAEKLELKDGYRIITNVGSYGGQEVPHLHFHLLGGRPLGKLVAES